MTLSIKAVIQKGRWPAAGSQVTLIQGAGSLLGSRQTYSEMGGATRYQQKLGSSSSPHIEIMRLVLMW